MRSKLGWAKYKALQDNIRDDSILGRHRRSSNGSSGPQVPPQPIPQTSANPDPKPALPKPKPKAKEDKKKPKKKQSSLLSFGNSAEVATMESPDDYDFNRI